MSAPGQADEAVDGAGRTDDGRFDCVQDLAPSRARRAITVAGGQWVRDRGASRRAQGSRTRAMDETSPQPRRFTEDRILGGRVVLRQPAKGYRAGLDAALLAAACDATGRASGDRGRLRGRRGAAGGRRAPPGRAVLRASNATTAAAGAGAAQHRRQRPRRARVEMCWRRRRRAAPRPAWRPVRRSALQSAVLRRPGGAARPHPAKRGAFSPTPASPPGPATC